MCIWPTSTADVLKAACNAKSIKLKHFINNKIATNQHKSKHNDLV